MSDIRWQAFFAATHRLSWLKVNRIAAKNRVEDIAEIAALRLRVALPYVIVKMGRRLAARGTTIDGESINDGLLKRMLNTQSHVERFLLAAGATRIEWQKNA